MIYSYDISLILKTVSSVFIKTTNPLLMELFSQVQCRTKSSKLNILNVPYFSKTAAGITL